MPEQATTVTTRTDGSTVTDIHSSPFGQTAEITNNNPLPASVYELAKSKVEPSNIDTLFIKIGDLIQFREDTYGNALDPDAVKAAKASLEQRQITIAKLEEFFDWINATFPFAVAPTGDEVRPFIHNKIELSYNTISTLTPELVQIVVLKSLILARIPEIPRTNGFKLFAKNFASSVLS